MRQNTPVIVLDFETTGLSPDYGGRAIEIGAVQIEDNRITQSFQSLMNPGVPVSAFIQSFTGINNRMLVDAPPNETVMRQFAKFLGEKPLVAHNASFDKQFLESEFRYVGVQYSNPVACSMLVARRLYPHAANHKLGTLVDYCGIEHDGALHRALADAQVTAQLWLSMIEQIKSSYGLATPSFQLMQELSKIPKKQVASFFAKRRTRQPQSLWHM